MKTIKWILVAPFLLIAVYLVGCLNSTFRFLVITGVNKELNGFLKEAEKESK